MKIKSTYTYWTPSTSLCYISLFSRCWNIQSQPRLSQRGKLISYSLTLSSQVKFFNFFLHQNYKFTSFTLNAEIIFVFVFFVIMADPASLEKTIVLLATPSPSPSISFKIKCHFQFRIFFSFFWAGPLRKYSLPMGNKKIIFFYFLKNIDIEGLNRRSKSSLQPATRQSLWWSTSSTHIILYYLSFIIFHYHYYYYYYHHHYHLLSHHPLLRLASLLMLRFFCHSSTTRYQVHNYDKEDIPV